MSDFGEALWENNADLKEALSDFLTRDFPLYAWSVRSFQNSLSFNYLVECTKTYLKIVQI